MQLFHQGAVLEKDQLRLGIETKRKIKAVK